MNLNLSGVLNAFKLLAKPSLCLPHATVPTFNDLPVPLEKAFEGQGRKVEIQAVVLDKDDCFAYPETNEIHPPYAVSSHPAPTGRPWSGNASMLQRGLTTESEQTRFRQLQEEYPGRRLLIVSNTAGATSHDRNGELAAELERVTGITVLSHRTKKPGCQAEIMAYFKQHPEAGVTHPAQIAIVGDRLMTDMMLANTMGSWGVWVKNGVAPWDRKSLVRPILFSSPFLQC